jgi:predicted component of type VI protein secretion system
VSERVTVGRSAENDIALSRDERVSRLHAVIERFQSTWCVRDLGSSNGTFVDGEPVIASRVLAHGDELRMGDSRLVLRAPAATDPAKATVQGEASPELTRRERDVLIALCRPMLNEAAFPQPASIHDIATHLVVSDAAVKFHLANLFTKFGLVEGGENRRVALANEAIRRRAVSVADLRPHTGSGT